MHDINFRIWLCVLHATTRLKFQTWLPSGALVYSMDHCFNSQDWQRSVVILSQHPFPSLFEELVSILAPLHLLHGSPILETACQNIASWYVQYYKITVFIYTGITTLRPGLSFGSTLELGFLDHTLQAYLPCTDDEPQFHETSETFNPLSHVSRVRAIEPFFTPAV